MKRMRDLAMRGLLLVMFVAGCGGVSLVLLLEFQTLAQGTVSPFSGEPTVRVLRDAGELQEFWNALYASRSPIPAVPAVDFPDKMVIAVVDAGRPTGGYSIAVTAVQSTTAGITVHAIQTSPAPQCLVTQSLTQPYHLVAVNMAPGKPSLVLSTAVSDCTGP